MISSQPTMPENSGPWCQARPPPRSQTFMAWRNVKVSFRGPEDFYGIWESKRSPSRDPKSFLTWGNVRKVYGWRKHVLVSTAVLSILGNGIFWLEAKKQKGFFPQCRFRFRTGSATILYAWKTPQVSTKEIACSQFREEGKGGGEYKASIFNYVRNSELQTDTFDENNTPSWNIRLKTRRLPRHIFIRIYSDGRGM